MLPLTLPDVRRVLLAMGDEPDKRLHRSAWSRFRRRHQAVAKQCHTVRRARPHLTTNEPPIQTLTAPLPDLTEARWRRIASLLPAESAIGRPHHDHRRVLTGILWVIRNGAGWNHLPDTRGPGATGQRRYRRWSEQGTWSAILEVLLAPDAPSRI